ncbi:MAG: RNA polymerase factor sigma-54 [Phycisphaerales bacterium]|nr:RNA polymerase factor sigma-54 [Phycisphaerales bacterium]
MRFETSQHMRLGQQMKLAPRMIQSMEILQMPLAELEERIEQELESNPTLEQSEGNPDAPEASPETTDADGEDRPLRIDEHGGGEEFARLDSYEAANPEAAANEYASGNSASESADGLDRLDHGSYSASRMAGERDAKQDAMAQAPARGGSLHDQLRGQWSLCEVRDDLRPLGELVIAALHDDGYLRTPLEELAKPPGEGQAIDPARMEEALRAVQLLLEPAGVAARTPAECLLLQLDALDDQGDSGWPTEAFVRARTVVEHHLEDLTQNRLPKVADKTGLSIDEIKDTLALLRRLSLSPARRLVEEQARPIIPDAIVEYDESEDRYIAYLNDSRLPVLRINQEYAKLAKDRSADRRDRDFIKTNLANAQWLLDAIGQRRHTLLRVVRAVVDAQRDYFDFGPQALRPLPMTGVAEQLGIHVATVSRAVADKHLATPRGIVALRKFFSGGVSTRGSAEAEPDELAWDAIKEALREVIDAEEKTRPLSDEALVTALKARGIDIARRTVAKYRDQLQIPPARLRKAF